MDTIPCFYGDIGIETHERICRLPGSQVRRCDDELRSGYDDTDGPGLLFPKLGERDGTMIPGCFPCVGSTFTMTDKPYFFQALSLLKKGSCPVRQPLLSCNAGSFCLWPVHYVSRYLLSTGHGGYSMHRPYLHPQHGNLLWELRPVSGI